MKHLESLLVDMEKTAVFEDSTYYYIGNLPSEKTIFFSGSYRCSKELLRSIEKSIVEAIWNDYDIAYVPGSPMATIIEEVLRYVGMGKLFCFLPRGLHVVSRGLLSKVLLTNGGVLSPCVHDSLFSKDNLKKAKTMAAAMSIGTILAEENNWGIYTSAQNALDRGRSIAILRPCLKGKNAREIAKEGCPIIDVFSEFLANPRFISYGNEGGSYGILGERFDIMDLQYGKW